MNSLPMAYLSMGASLSGVGIADGEEFLVAGLAAAGRVKPGVPGSWQGGAHLRVIVSDGLPDDVAGADGGAAGGAIRRDDVDGVGAVRMGSFVDVGRADRELDDGGIEKRAGVAGGEFGATGHQFAKFIGVKR